MAHNLASRNGKASFAYYGEPPWHRMGTQLNKPATAEEAIQSAGLDYHVSLASLSTVDGIPIPKARAVIRDDAKSILGVVSERYVPVQNEEAFGFLDAVVGDSGLAYHTAGALGQGEKIFLLAKLPRTIRVKQSDDLVDQFLLLSNAHDGTAALRVLFTPIRVVCQNTLSIALSRGQGEGISVRHQGDIASKVLEAQRILGLATRFFGDAEEKINHLAKTYPTAKQLEEYFERLCPDPEEGQDISGAQKKRAEFHRLYEEGMGNDAAPIKHTLWAAYNAVTESVDHRSYRGKTMGDRENNRLNSIWWGKSARIKEQAWDQALQIAG